MSANLLYISQALIVANQAARVHMTRGLLCRTAAGSGDYCLAGELPPHGQVVIAGLIAIGNRIGLKRATIGCSETCSAELESGKDMYYTHIWEI